MSIEQMSIRQRPLTDEEKKLQDNHLVIITDATFGLLMTMSKSLHLSVDKVVLIMLSVAMKSIKDLNTVEAMLRSVSAKRWEIIENTHEGKDDERRDN